MTRKSEISALNTMAQNSPMFGNVVEKTVTFAAATTGAIAFHKIADVTGLVAVQVLAICTTNVAGTGNISVGTATNDVGLIPITTGTDIDAGEIWHDATPDASVENMSVITARIVSEHIQYRITANTLTGGVVKFIISWAPLSVDGNVVIA